MPPKRSSSGSSKAKKRRTSAPDWRVPIFYWRGKITNETTWSGTWVTSETGLPSDAEFAESANTFALECSEQIGMLVMMSDGTAEDVPTATFKGLTNSTMEMGSKTTRTTLTRSVFRRARPLGDPSVRVGGSAWPRVGPPLLASSSP